MRARVRARVRAGVRARLRVVLADEDARVGLHLVAAGVVEGCLARARLRVRAIGRIAGRRVHVYIGLGLGLLGVSVVCMMR